MLRKIIALALSAILTGTLLSACGGAAEKELNVLTWEGYVPSEVVDDFEAATGIKINYATFGTNEEMYSKISAQKNTYDIVICSDYIIDIMISESLLAELDMNKLENHKNIGREFLSPYYDPDNKYTVPYSTAAGIIVYDAAAVDFPINGYADLWNEAFKNKVVLIDGDRDIIGLTLKTLGYSINETDPEKLAEAEEKLMELKENIVKFDTDTPHNAIINGDAVIGYMFGSHAAAAKQEIPTIEICYPEEGLALYADSVVVPAGAPNYDNAMSFINYILDGEVSAKISTLINYPNTNAAAKDFLPQEYLENKMVNIAAEYMEGAEMYIDLGEASVRYDEIWTRFKSR